tara:strand:- start:92 stop:919 length:828 start_codon:yes stop_codon:yes gene_type:complete
MNNVKYEILLIDNASKDGSIEKLKADYELDYKSNRLIVIENENNGGFAYGNNIGLKCAQGEFIVLINSDAELTDDSVVNATQYLRENKNVGTVSARLINQFGQLDEACKRGFPDPVSSLVYILRLSRIFPNKMKLNKYKLNSLSEFKLHKVDAISGAFMVLPKHVIDEVGLLDEQFFMYGEDLDWCYRIKSAGYEVVYNPYLGNVIHYKGKSSKKNQLKTTHAFYHSMMLFYNKNYKARYPYIVSIIVSFGVWGLYIVKILQGVLHSLFNIETSN